MEWETTQLVTLQLSLYRVSERSCVRYETKVCGLKILGYRFTQYFVSIVGSDVKYCMYSVCFFLYQNFSMMQFEELCRFVRKISWVRLYK